MRAKTPSIILTTIMAVFIFSGIAETDMVLLDNGRYIEGQMLQPKDGIARIRLDTGQDISVSTGRIRVVLRSEDITMIDPENKYEYLKDKLDARDPKAKYDLGVFCLQTGLLAEASDEFRELEDININYRRHVQELYSRIEEARIDNLLSAASLLISQLKYDQALIYINFALENYPGHPKTQKLKGLSAWANEKISERLSSEPVDTATIRARFEDSQSPLPYYAKDMDTIISYLINLDDEAAQELYVEICHEKAQQFFNKAKKESDPYEKTYLLTLSARLFNIAYNASGGQNILARQLLNQATAELNNAREEIFIIPAYTDIDIIDSVYKNSSDDLRRNFAVYYRQKAGMLEAKLTQTADNLYKKKLAQDILNCYTYVYMYFNNYSEGAPRGLSTLLYKEAQDRVLKLAGTDS